MTDAEIKALFGTVPYFADEVIQDYRPEMEKQPFRKHVSWCHAGSVNIMRICGTQHPDYIGLTWRNFLRTGRRMDINIKAYRENSAYYTASGITRLPGMFVHFVDGKGYVAEDGNHRTCIGKFFLYNHESPYMHGLNVTEQQTDLRMFALYTRLLKVLPGYCKAIPEAVEIKRDDGKGWAAYFYDVRVRVVNARSNGYEEVFSADELEDHLLPALRNPLLARFGEFKKLLS
jgi:hypothetical protein